MTARRTRARRGLTLLEATMTMVVMLVIAAAGLIMFQTTNDNWKMSQATLQIGQVSQSVRAMYKSSPNYSGLTPADIINTMPTSMVDSTSNTLKNAFNGLVTVSPANAGGGADSGFEIGMQGLPESACVRLAGQDLGRVVVSVTINGTVYPPAVHPNLAQGSCGSGMVNTVAWLMQ